MPRKWHLLRTLAMAVSMLEHAHIRIDHKRRREDRSGSPARPTDLSTLRLGLTQSCCRCSDNVCYPKQFGEHILRASFTAGDPFETLAVGCDPFLGRPSSFRSARGSKAASRARASMRFAGEPNCRLRSSLAPGPGE